MAVESPFRAAGSCGAAENLVLAKLLDRIHKDLGISTLEDLEAAAGDGRLGRIEGIGPRRLRSIRDQLEARLGRRRPAEAGRAPRRDDAGGSPAVEEILGVDREYREKAAAGQHTTIAPRRFNPRREAWLPVLHTRRGERLYTALYSNTSLAHQLGRSRDWVVIYLEDGGRERQWTVVTGQQGGLAGKRHVRGREEECRKFYEIQPVAGPG